MQFYYKDVLPKTSTLPPRTIRTGKIESSIIRPILTNIIFNWIDKRSTIFTRTENDPLYRFKLIYRCSRD